MLQDIANDKLCPSFGNEPAGDAIGGQLAVCGDRGRTRRRRLLRA